MFRFYPDYNYDKLENGNFKATVTFNNLVIAEASGETKKQAAQFAAKYILDNNLLGDMKC